ncbi:MAG TPA: hypothetical protein VE615_05720 [Gaiellaceae bacterium]|jgi:hypothetical protein|nr:hypothetical protein [Gaiellaceae bacterium]
MSRFLVWYGFFGAAGAWSAQLVAGYGLEEALCPGGESAPWIVAVTLAAGLVAAGSIGAAYRGRRTPAGTVQFLSVVGMLAGLFFLLLIALGGLQLLSLESCDQG